MSLNTNNLKRLGNQFSIPITADEDGYLGRACSQDECLGYFKIMPGTGIQGPSSCHCPYCGRSGDSKTFFTLKNVVSAFDAFGRETTSTKGSEVHFQNLRGGRRNVLEKFGFDFGDAIASEQWNFVCRVFQKRHLLAHKMGVIDDEYV